MAGFCKTAVESSTTLKHYRPRQPFYQLHPSSGSPRLYSKFMPTNGFPHRDVHSLDNSGKPTLCQMISDSAPFHGSSLLSSLCQNDGKENSSYLPILASPKIQPQILSWLQSLTDQLNKHFSTFAYLFGNRPSLADFPPCTTLCSRLARSALGITSKTTQTS